VQAALGEGLLEPVEVFATKDLGEGVYGEEELRTFRRDPATLLRSQSPPGDETVHVEMLVEILAPGVEHERGAQVAPQPLGITPEGLEGLPGRLEQEGIEDPRVPLGHRIEGMGERKDAVEIRDGQEVGHARLDPARGSEALALGAMPIPTGVIADVVRPTVIALEEVAA
jgi:hypothetical protein